MLMRAKEQGSLPLSEGTKEADRTASSFIREIDGLLKAREVASAERLATEALGLFPNHADVINAYGCVRWESRAFLDALVAYRAAAKLEPRSAGILNNLSTAYKQIKRFGTAEIYLRRALEITPQDASLLHNLGLCLADAGKHGEAIAAYNRALENDPLLDLARWGRARSFLYLGNYERGWNDYEVRLETGQVPKRETKATPWSGESYVDKTLVVFAEQGFGDTIWACRYLQEAKAMGGQLVVECQPELYSLLKPLGMSDLLIPKGDPLPHTDFYCFFCSLPRILFGVKPSPSGDAYLRSVNWRRRTYKKTLESSRAKLKIGFIWSGSTTFSRNEDRALTLQAMLDAIDIPGVKLYSLQKGEPERELKQLTRRSDVIDLAPRLFDFAETAAAISELDLVIMTDSAVAHLAGAMGKPVWVLLGHAPHWLWLTNGTSSPWYSSMRLFRSELGQSWDPVLDSVSKELLKLVKLD